MTAVTLTADGTTSVGGKAKAMVRDSVKTVIAASMVGTAIEFYDFYAYGTAAANYFPRIFFSAKDNPTVALLMSLLTFAIAFIARPLGSLIFGHFGDRMGRKTTLVVSLMTMGRHVPHRLPADLQSGRCRRGRGTVSAAFHPGHRPWRRMVRCCAGRHRERARRQACAVRLLPGARRPDRLLPVERHLLRAGVVQ